MSGRLSYVPQQASRATHAPYLHDLRKASVGSISSLILNSTSSIMGPQLQNVDHILREEPVVIVTAPSGQGNDLKTA